MEKRTDIPTSDENLVEMHRKAKKRKRRRLIVTLVIAIVVVLAAITVSIVVLKNRVAQQVGSTTSEVESAEVTTGSISTTVSGSGTLTNEEEESITVPSSLEILDYYVEEGDTVSEGDLIATVTNASLLSAMSDAQDTLDSLDEQLEDASGDTVDSTISSSVSGRVKYIAVSSGDDVATVMYESGALMLLSLDGYMAVDITTDALSVSDTVVVTDSDGTEYEGTVQALSGKSATIVVTDNGTTYQDEVTVTDADGTEIGTGTLYIHSQMAITGYAGTVSTVSVSENTSVSSGTTLLTLTDTETSANYDTILKSREEAEETLETLIRIYKEGGICATASGTIASLGTSSSEGSDASSMSQSGSSSSGSTTIATISLDENMTITISVDESDILSLSVGQEAAVTIDSIGEDAFSGTVTSISTSASSGSGVTSYSAVVTIAKTESMLSGMSASVVVTIEGVDNALLIPIDALHQTSATAYVYTEYDESTGEFSGMVEVTTGLSNSSYVEITDGLSEGDTVYYSSSGDSSSSFSMDFSTMDMGGGTMEIPSGTSSDMGGNSGGMGGSTGGGDMGGGMPGGN